jgi:hypothetical protein
MQPRFIENDLRKKFNGKNWIFGEKYLLNRIPGKISGGKE